MFRSYRPSLAFVHHRGFGEFAEAAGPELLRILRANGIVGGHVVDLGCGDGKWLRALTEDGFTATGIDQSAAFVRLARRAAPQASVRHASLFRTAFPPCDAMTALGEVFNYLSRGDSAPPSLFRAFRRAYAALRPGGLLIFDLLVSGPPMRYETARTPTDWAVFVRVTEDARRGRLARHIVAFRRRGSHYTRDHETHVLQVPARSRVLSDLRRAGFVVRAAAGYGAVALASRRVAFVAKKPALLERLRFTTAASIASAT